MGRLTLTIIVHPALRNLNTVQALVEKGHNVVEMDEELAQADLILGPRAHYYTPAMGDLNILEPALKRARARHRKSVEEEG